MTDRQLPKNPKAYKAMELIAKGKTQSDVADRLNVSQSTVSGWKRQIQGTSGRNTGQNSRAFEVSDTRRTAIVEPGRIVIQEHIRSCKVSESTTTQPTQPTQRSTPGVTTSYQRIISKRRY